MNEIIFEILKCVVVVCCLIITRYLVPYLKSKIEDSTSAEMNKWIKDTVDWAEQTIKGSGKGEEKKEKVMDFLTILFAEKGFNISFDQLNVLVEAAVKSLNK